MPGLHSRECQQYGVTTVQISFPDLYSLCCTLGPRDQQWFPPWEPLKQLWGALYQHWLLTAKGSITRFPKCLLKQEKTNSLSQKQLWSAGSDGRWRSLFLPLSGPFQGRIQWEHVIIGPYQCYTQNTSLSHSSEGAYRSEKIPLTSLLSLCTIRIVNAPLFL